MAFPTDSTYVNYLGGGYHVEVAGIGSTGTLTISHSAANTIDFVPQPIPAFIAYTGAFLVSFPVAGTGTTDLGRATLPCSLIRAGANGLALVAPAYNGSADLTVNKEDIKIFMLKPNS